MKNFRYSLEEYSGMGSRYTCPSCEKPKVYSRFVDSREGVHLPYKYGRCERLNNCGYFLSPYHDEYSSNKKDKTSSKRIPKRKTVKIRPREIPRSLVRKTLLRQPYCTFCKVLKKCFGEQEVNRVRTQFLLGHSKYAIGSTIFWLFDTKYRVFGGQVVAFTNDGSTKKYYRADGSCRRMTNWAHTLIKGQYTSKGIQYPDWLLKYEKFASKYPFPFGLHQLDDPGLSADIGLVEAPKTAVICSIIYPHYTWMAIGALSWLNNDRMKYLKGRRVTLFPDNGGFELWESKMKKIRCGVRMNISDLLEWERIGPGDDIADIILDEYSRMHRRDSPENKPPI